MCLFVFVHSALHGVSNTPTSNPSLYIILTATMHTLSGCDIGDMMSFQTIGMVLMNLSKYAIYCPMGNTEMPSEYK